MRASVSIDTAAAKKAPGVVAVVTGLELAKVITPWVGVLTHLKGIKSAPQHAIAVERARWQGEAVCAVVARSRAEAEDACELVEVERRELRWSPIPKPRSIAARSSPSRLGDNLSFERVHGPAIRTRVSRRRRRRRNNLRVRPPHRRQQRAARHPRRLESGRAAADRLPRHPGAAHDAEPVRQASRARGASGPGHHQGRRRLVRDQGGTPMPTRWRRSRSPSCSGGR